MKAITTEMEKQASTIRIWMLRRKSWTQMTYEICQNWICNIIDVIVVVRRARSTSISRGQRLRRKSWLRRRMYLWSSKQYSIQTLSLWFFRSNDLNMLVIDHFQTTTKTTTVDNGYKGVNFLVSSCCCGMKTCMSCKNATKSDPKVASRKEDLQEGEVTTWAQVWGRAFWIGIAGRALPTK